MSNILKGQRQLSMFGYKTIWFYSWHALMSILKYLYPMFSYKTDWKKQTSIFINNQKNILDFPIEKMEKCRSLETDKRNASSWENSSCVTVKLWDCKRPTGFQDPTCHSHISATVADCACMIEKKIYIFAETVSIDNWQQSLLKTTYWI